MFVDFKKDETAYLLQHSNLKELIKNFYAFSQKPWVATHAFFYKSAKKFQTFFSMVRYKVNIGLNRHGQFRFPILVNNSKFC